MSNVYGQTLLDDMVQAQGLPVSLVRQAAREILTVIRQGLVRDGVVHVSNFGTFRLKAVAARKGFNPQTRERLTIPAHQRVIFSPCKALRELIQPVHQAPIPLREEKETARVAARSAPIAASASVVTRTITPPASSTEQIPEKDVSSKELTTEPSTPLQPVRNIDEAAPSTEQHDVELNDMAQYIDDPSDRATSPSEIENSENRSDKSHNFFYIGGAAAIVITAVIAGTYFGMSTDKTVAIPQHSVQQPTHANSGNLTLSAATPAPPAVEHATEPQAGSGNEASSDDTARNTVIPQPQPDTDAITVSEGSYEEVLDTTPDMAVVADKGLQVSQGAGSSVGMPQGRFYFTERLYSVTDGDSLWRLAKKHYDDPLLWPHIYQANAAIIANPDQLHVHEELVIPSLQGSPKQLTRTDRRNIAEGYYLTYLHYKKTGHKDAFFALLEAKRYDNRVVEEHRSMLQLSKVEEVLLNEQAVMPF